METTNEIIDWIMRCITVSENISFYVEETDKNTRKRMWTLINRAHRRVIERRELLMSQGFPVDEPFGSWTNTSREDIINELIIMEKKKPFLVKFKNKSIGQKFGI